MDKPLKNLFPAAISNDAIEIFGKQEMQAVLLHLVSANTVTEQTEDAPSFDLLLHPHEIATLRGYKLPKRRSEYLTGRICAKMATQDFLSANQPSLLPLIASEIEIINEEDGRPAVYIHTDKIDMLKMDISISHCGDYGVALAAEAICGIDLQQQKATLLRVYDKFCSKTEFKLLESFLPDREAVTRLTFLWAAKEAAKKALSNWQMPGFLDLELSDLWKLKEAKDCMALSLHIPRSKNQQRPEKATVMATMFDDYALAICLLNEESNNAGTPRS